MPSNFRPGPRSKACEFRSLFWSKNNLKTFGDGQDPFDFSLGSLAGKINVTLLHPLVRLSIGSICLNFGLAFLLITQNTSRN